MRTKIEHSPVRPIRPIERWFLRGLSVHDFEPEPMPNCGPFQPDWEGDFLSAIEQLPAADKRDWEGDFLAVCGLLAVLLPLVGAALLIYLKLREVGR